MIQSSKSNGSDLTSSLHPFCEQIERKKTTEKQISKSNTFRKEGIPLRVAHKSYTLDQKSSLSQQQQGTDMHEGQLPYLQHQYLCLLRNAVYQITCNNCNQHYIGSTTRFIHDRVKELLNNDNSSVKKHISKCQTKSTKASKLRLLC